MRSGAAAASRAGGPVLHTRSATTSTTQRFLSRLLTFHPPVLIRISMPPRRIRPPRVTAHDVAARAGVSQPTVSLVLNGRSEARVAAATRERVIQAAEDLGYRPNLMARGLVLRRSFALGVVVPDLGNPFFLDVVRGVERVASESGYAVLLCDSKEVSPEVHLETLRTRQVDGVILDPITATTAGAQVLAELNAVVIEQPSEAWLWQATDAVGAGRLAAEHLLGLGHRDIAILGPANPLHGFRMRERGFVQLLRDSGLAVRSECLRRVAATVEGGQQAMRALLAQSPRPTAVFCVNDLLALGALKVCLQNGVRVPEQLSIMGCDDIEMAQIVTPELSTIAVPAREVGARAARQLLRVVGGRPPPRTPVRPLPVRAVIRRSTGPVPSTSDF
jgi:LacI family transcriptional regulator